MTPERHRQVGNLYHAALETEPEARAAFLDGACGADEELRREVESLLGAHGTVGNYFAAPALEVAAGLLAARQDPSLMGYKLSHYSVLSLIGAGGMGEVYLAEDVHLGRKVALKLLPTEFTEEQEPVRRFEMEARAVSSLNHPNIVTIFEVGEVDGRHFIATEYIEGQTLRERLAAAQLELRDTLDIAIQVASAVGAAHKAGIVHRDIKPENIMLRPDGLVKVLDFGLAKLTEAQSTTILEETSTLARVETKSGLILGTVSYMSPEQARGLSVDGRTDIFSLGVLLYEMVAGRAPFGGTTASDLIAAILKEEPVPLSEYSREAPAELEWMMKKALAKDRDERYQAITELQIDLKRLRQELDLKTKLDGIAPGRLRGESGQPLALRSTPEIAGVDTGAVSTNKRYTRSALFGGRMLVVVAAIVIFSFASFYVGLKKAPGPSQPTFRQLTFRRGAISSARFAKDGKTIVYSAAFDGKPVELFTSRLESPESSLVKLQIGGRAAGIQAISSAGEMAILLDCELDWGQCRNGTLARAPLLGGTTKDLMENVSEADWGPDGKELAVVRINEENQYQLEYPAGTVLHKSTGKIRYPRVSPKGDMVAFIDDPILADIGGKFMVVDRGGQKKVLSDDGWRLAWSLAWSPTGNEIWFSAGKKMSPSLYAVTLSGQQRLVYEGNDLSICDISPDGRILAISGKSRSRMISFTAGDEKERELSWFDWSTSADISADGKTLLFYEWGRAVGANPLVYVRKMDGSDDPVRLGQGKALALSPDGKWALAVQDGPPAQLVLLPTGPGEQRLLPRGAITEFHYASWFPDGQRILFTGLTEFGKGLRSYVQDISGGQPSPIFTEEGVIALSVSTNGKRLFAWAPDNKDSNGKYYLSPLDRSPPTPIRGLGFGEVPIQWGAEGRFIYARGSGDFDSNIYRIDPSSGRREPWKPITPDPVGLIGIEVRPGGVQISRDGKSYVYTYWVFLQDLVLIEGLK